MRNGYRFGILLFVAAVVAWFSHGLFVYVTTDNYAGFPDALGLGATSGDWVARVVIFLLLAVIAFLTGKSELTSELRKSQAELQQVFEMSSDAMWLVSPDYEVLRVNDTLCKLLGLAEDRLVGMRCYDMFPCSRCHTDDCAVAVAVRGEEMEECELDRALPDGRKITCLMSAVPVRDAKGRVSGIVECCRDISGRKRMEEALRESETKYRELVEGVNEAVYRMALPEGTYEYMSPVAEAVFGYSGEEFMSNPHLIRYIMHPSFADYFEEQWAALLSGNVPPTYEYQVVDADGNERWIAQSNKGIFDAEGRLIAIEGMCREVTGRKAAEEGLRWYQRAADTSSDLLVMVDRDHVYRTVNAAYARMHGRAREEIVGHAMAEILGEEVFEEKIRSRLERCLSGEEIRFREWLDYPGQGLRCVDATYTPYTDANGTISHATITARDTTAEKDAEEAARQHGELLRAVAFAAQSFLRATDWERNLEGFLARLGKTLQASRAVLYKNEIGNEGEVVISLRSGWAENGDVEELPGHGEGKHPYESVGLERWREELSQGQVVAGLVADLPEAEQEVFAPHGIEAVIAVPVFVGERWWGFISLKHEQAGREWTDAETDALRTAADILAGAIERRHMEEDVRRERDRAQNYLDIAGVMLVALDTEGDIRLINRRGCEILGYDEEELIGESWSDTALPTEVRDGVRAVFAQLMTGDAEPVEYAENIIQRRDGEQRVILWHNRVIRDEEGSIVGTLSSGEDITERKQAEESLRQVSEAQEVILDSVRAMIWHKDTENNILRANRAAAEATGLSTEQMARKSCWELFPEEADHYYKDDLEVLESGQAKLDIIEQIQVASGEKRWLCTDKIPYWDEDGKIAGVIVFAVDITDLKQTQEALAAETERLRVTLRSIGDGVIATDVEGHVVLMNKVAEALTGWSQREAEGRMLGDAFKIINEHTREVVENPVERVLTEGEVVGLANDTVLVSRDGTERVIADSGAPIRDQESRIVGAVLVFRDMTEARQREEEARRAETLESIGVLAGGLAHDFNNLLSGIFGNITLARLDVADGEDASARLTAAENAMSRAKRLTEQLLTFSTGGTPVREVVSLAGLLSGAAEFALSGANTRCQLVTAPDLWHVEADPSQISQVVDNLLINADQAMPEGGVITLRAENVSVGPGKAASPPGARSLTPGDYVHIAIEDTGIGIPSKLLSRVFDPYFTTKQTGSGLGLSVSYSIVRQHNGHVHMVSEVGVGTTCHIYLPAVQMEAAVGVEKPGAIVRGAGRVLVLEDEDIVWDVCNGMLEVLGYEARRAHEGAEMLEIYRTAMGTEQAFDVVIMDLTIPAGMGGKEAIWELREMDPGVKAVVSSGYSSDPVMAEHETHGFHAMIAKPYRVEELGKVLLEVMGSGDE